MTARGKSAILATIMKQTFLYLTLLTGIFAGVMAPAAFADEDASPKASKKVKKDKKAADSTLPAVRAAVKEIKFLSGKPSSKAKYYIYLHSASWCGPCKALMPEIVKDYKKMQKKKVEIILIGHDKTEAAAKDYLKHYDADFPCILYTDPAAQSLPGFTTQFAGIPHATIVDENGNVLCDDHGRKALEWKTICKPSKKKK